MKEANEEFKAKLQDNFNSYIELMDKNKANMNGHTPAKEVFEKRVCSAYSGLVTTSTWRWRRRPLTCGKPCAGGLTGSPTSPTSQTPKSPEPTSCKKCRARCKEDSPSTASAAKLASTEKEKLAMPMKSLHEMLHQRA